MSGSNPDDDAPEDAAEDAPVAVPGGVVVRIMDLSGGAEDNIVEDVKGFGSVEHANAFARSYVVDSLERCRTAGMTADDVLQTWFAFGEDAEVLDEAAAPVPDGWRSGTELAALAATPAEADERDWRALDPRRHGLAA